MYFKNKANPKSQITKKNQIPNSKKQKAPNLKFQIPKETSFGPETSGGICDLEFIWNLVLVI